jgi:hypothetical protein
VQYFAFLLLFVIILMAVGIAVYVKKDSAGDYMTAGWCAATPAVIADLQVYFTCCGLKYFNDSLAWTDPSTQTSYPAGCAAAQANGVSTLKYGE